MSGLPYIAGNAEYRYPAAGDEPAQLGAKCLILTKGGVCVIGMWGDDAVAWAPLPKRNREKEGIMNASLSPTQQYVVDHYEGGEFTYVTSVAQAKTVGDGLFAFCVAEAGDAADAEEFTGMLERAIDQLRSLRDEVESAALKGAVA